MKKMNKFWRWVTNEVPTQEKPNESRTLFLDGTIAEESWFDDDVTPALFKSELEEGKGDITVWINSPGGDCFAAAQIYNMLRDYPGKVTVKVDGLAASAASVVAMAGDEVLVSPVSMLMIHNPSTVAMGSVDDMQKAIEMLDEVKNSIINAYETKTGLSRAKLSRLMDEETWMDANKAVELGFADSVTERNKLYESEENPEQAGENPAEDHIPMLYSVRRVEAARNKKICDYVRSHATPPTPTKDEKTTKKHTVEELQQRLDLMKKFM